MPPVAGYVLSPQFLENRPLEQCQNRDVVWRPLTSRAHFRSGSIPIHEESCNSSLLTGYLLRDIFLERPLGVDGMQDQGTVTPLSPDKFWTVNTGAGVDKVIFCAHVHDVWRLKVGALLVRRAPASDSVPVEGPQAGGSPPGLVGRRELSVMAPHRDLLALLLPYVKIALAVVLLSTF